MLTGAYGSPLAEAEFTTDPDAQREVINGWVAEQTEDRIPELSPPRALTPETALVLVNAVALDAPWEFPFDPAATADEPFTRPNGTTVDVPTMHYDEHLASAYTDTYQAVEPPYGVGPSTTPVPVPHRGPRRRHHPHHRTRHRPVNRTLSIVGPTSRDRPIRIPLRCKLPGDTGRRAISAGPCRARYPVPIPRRVTRAGIRSGSAKSRAEA